MKTSENKPPEEDMIGISDASPNSQALVESEDESGVRLFLVHQTSTPPVLQTNIQAGVVMGEKARSWDGPDDPRNPYNWKTYRKISIAILVSLAQLVALMTASVTAAALDQIAADVGMSASQAQISFSIYFLGMAFSPFFIAALSEMYGRRLVWLWSNIYFLVWNTVCPVGRIKVIMILGRFMAAAGATAGVILTGPILTDMYTAEMRGRSLAIASLLPYLGPALGPIVGGLAAQHLDWPWLFWILSLFAAAIVLVAFLALPETYAPILLARKDQSQNADCDEIRYRHLETDSDHRSFMTRLCVNIYRPVRQLLRRPVMQIISLNMGINFSVYCLLLSTFATMFIDFYHESKTTSSLNYIAVAFGTTAAAQAGGPAMDWIWRCLSKKHNGEASPEYRLPYIAAGNILGTIGLIWYGWAVQARAHWMVVDVGVATFVTGNFMLSMGFLTYAFDEFKHAASASAASRVPSYILGFVFPIVSPDMFDRLGYGWGNTLLALILAVVGLPSVLLLWIWGPKVRSLGRIRDC